MPSGVLLGLGVLGHFGLKNKTRKIVKIHKDFELQHIVMYSFVLKCPNTLNIYYSQKELKHFSLDILLYTDLFSD